MVYFGSEKKKDPLFLTLFVLAAFIFFPFESAQGETRNVTGSVKVEGNKPLKNLVAYLEPIDPIDIALTPMNHKVKQKGRKFDPSVLVATEGDTVLFLNDEDREIDHNIYSLSKAINFDLGLGARGSVLKLPLPQGGRLNFYCSVHKFMEGRMVILSNRFFSLLSTPGSFIIPNVPFGKWKLQVHVFHRRYKTEPLEIIVSEDRPNDIFLKVKKK